MSLVNKIGKYQILGVLGQGGMGVVYKALDPSIGREVAIKTIHKHLLTSSTGANQIVRFTREAQAAGRFLHRNIVTIFEYGEHEGTPYLVMEFVEGRELKEIIAEKGKLSPAEAVDIFSQVCSGLEHAHQKGIVHRDLKPANIFMLPDGTAKIADFGIARIQNAEITGEGEVLGTPYYMSPEQLMAKKIDGRSDLFSLAVVLYEALTGQRPFMGEAIPEIMIKILTESPRLPTSINPAVPLAFNSFLSQALEKEPEKRFQSASEFAEALQQTHKGKAPSRAAAVASGSIAEVALSGSFDPAALIAIETALTRRLGPIAKVMLKRKAGAAVSLKALIETLSAEIPNESDRGKFIAELSTLKASADRSEVDLRLLSTSKLSAVAADGSVAGFDAEFLMKLEAALTTYLGPMAKLIIKRSASLSSSKEDLCNTLSQQIVNLDDRKKFLSRVLSE
jgi:serine/threonine protein kinase